MKKIAAVLALAFGLTTVSAIAANTSGWWHHVSAQASANAPADHDAVCAAAKSKLRSLYSDVTTIKFSPSFDMYNRIIYCRASGQSQQK